MCQVCGGTPSQQKGLPPTRRGAPSLWLWGRGGHDNDNDIDSDDDTDNENDSDSDNDNDNHNRNGNDNDNILHTPRLCAHACNPYLIKLGSCYQPSCLRN